MSVVATNALAAILVAGKVFAPIAAYTPPYAGLMSEDTGV